jgi:hypothetical protein
VRVVSFLGIVPAVGGISDIDIIRHDRLLSYAR